MNCARHLAAYLHGEGNLIDIPAAVVVHHGDSLCANCFRDALNEIPDPPRYPGEIDTGVTWPTT